MSTNEQVPKISTDQIAALSRIRIGESGSESVQKKLSGILEAFQVIASVEVAQAPEHRAACSRADLREDVALESLGQDRALANAPEAYNGCFRVPPVLA